MNCNILLKKEEANIIGHCLELDVVMTAPTRAAAKKDIIALIKAAVAFAVENDNLDNLYLSVPPGAWKEFFEKNGKDRLYFSAP